MAPPARVLLVDDDPDFCEALSDRLRSLGFQVTVATRGAEALRLCREEPPAIGSRSASSAAKFACACGSRRLGGS